MTRRTFFRLAMTGAAAAAGAGLAEGCSRPAPSSQGASPSQAGRTRLPSTRLPSTGTRPTGDVQRFRSRPDLLPAAVEVDIDKAGQSSGLVLMDSHTGPGDQGPMILDGQGNLVWFRPVSKGPRAPKRAMNLRAQLWKGEPVLTWWEGDVVAAHGEGEYVLASPSYEELTRVRAANGYSGDLHEFLLTPNGTALFTCYGLGHGDLSAYGGKPDGAYFYGVAQEVEVSTGKVVFEWRSDEHIGLDESYAPVADYGPGPWDYFHINSLGLTDDGHLLVCARNTWCVYKVDRGSGKVIWRLGGKRTDFSFGPGAHFAWQHDANEQPGGLLTVFDNGAGEYRTEPQSRGLVLSLDEASREVKLEREFLHPGPPLLAAALGSVQLLAEGHVFVGWGAQGAFTEYAADGAALLDGRLAGRGSQSYRAFRQAWTGQPKERPAVTTSRHGQGVTVYISWNGATEVTDWLVIAGGRPSAMESVGLARKVGFETAVELAPRPNFVAVAGLGIDGRELGRSATLAT
jgi:hypothetical protein